MSDKQNFKEIHDQVKAQPFVMILNEVRSWP